MFFFSVGHVQEHGICAWHTIHTYPLYFSSQPSPLQRRFLISIMEHWHQPPRGSLKWGEAVRIQSEPLTT